MISVYKNPYISKVKIKNFRNFLNVEVALTHKQVIVGENNVGKTNFIRALQLILDKDFSDNDRQLSESDFHDSIEDPMGNGVEIIITVEIQGYEHNQKLLAQLQDASISDTPPTLQITYKFYPNKDENERIINYNYIIFKGNHEDRSFRNEDRNFLNIFVIKALRDVERELKAGKKSPLYKLVKQYEIAPNDLEEISDALQEAADEVTELDEIVHIKNSLTNRFNLLSGLQIDSQINLRTFDVDPERLLYTLQAYMGINERPVSELSLGLANILYVSLMLLLLKDRTIKAVLSSDQYAELQENDAQKILSRTYVKTQRGNFVLKDDLSEKIHQTLYEFMDEHNHRVQAFTILVIEEPEAHLHPILQRLIYKEVLFNSKTSVVFTTHSTFITSVAPIETIVHISQGEGSSKAFSTADLQISEEEKKDIERYVDSKRSELYLAKGIILVEGITEEYLIPVSAEILEMPLDQHGIVVCNIDSTNFKPYIQLLSTLNIPWVLITDGDYYKKETIVDPKTQKTTTEKTFHTFHEDDFDHDFLGHELISKILIDIEAMPADEIPKELDKQDKLFQGLGCFVGFYTFEVDMMDASRTNGMEALKATYGELKPGGQEMQSNFENDLANRKFWTALSKIDANIGKGRFAQRLATHLTEDLVPLYVKKAIKHIVSQIHKEHE